MNIKSVVKYCPFLLIPVVISCRESTTVVTYPAPKEITPSEDYQIEVNGNPVFVYPCRVSARPINQVWPGHQRPLDQTETASFAYFDFSGQVKVMISSKKEVTSVAVKPSSYNITPVVKGNDISFALNKPCQLIIEVNGRQQALHLFANPPEKNRPDPEDPSVHYFGPGYHDAGKIRLESNQSVYIAGGAVVHGVIQAVDVTNVKVCGRGILDASRIGRSDDVNMISFWGCDHAAVDGIIFTDPHIWTVVAVKCRDIHINNIKLIGLWRYNADGIDLVNSQDAVIENCFVRSFDDNIVLKGFPAWGRDRYDTESLPLKDITVRNCVLYGDWGRTLEIGAETRTDSIYNVLFQDIDIVYFVQRAMDVQNGDRALVGNITFENIRIENALTEGFERQDIPEPDPDHPDHPSKAGMLLELFSDPNPYSKDTLRGRINGIVYRNIEVTGDFPVFGRIAGLDGEHQVENVLFENFTVRGKKIISPEAANIRVNEYAKDIRFE
jgi:hypothetical protein